ncbi:MAG: hypothetical protein PF505_10305 [Vallitaleaceae bacterium]|jgi:hypothetical protein|nr:hypothetical protein [Vallitaleaceae bacterium]
MKDKELRKIYRFDANENAYFLDIQLEDYRDAYSEWDYSPFVNRDLDEDLIEYILGCSYEIPHNRNMVIIFHLINQQYNAKREKRSIQGMYNYFDYRIRKIKSKRIRTFRDTIAFLVIGSILLLLGALADQYIQGSIIAQLLSEGLFIGGWVMIWEMFSSWFFNINQLTRKIKHFTRLQKVNIVYEYKD